MATINNIVAGNFSANVGLSPIQFDPKEIRGAILVPKGFIITNAQQAALLVTLQAASQVDQKNQRLYPIANFVDFKDNSEKPVVQAFGYGAELTVRDGIYKFSFQFLKGGKPLNDALRKFNGQNWDFFFIDSKNTLYGTKFIDATGLNCLKAIPSIEFYAPPYGWNDGKKVTEYMAEFKFLAKYTNELGWFIQDADFDILDNITGLQDAVLTGVADTVSGSYDISVKTPYGINLGDSYGSTISTGLNQISAWKFTNVTGGVIPVLTVSYVNSAFLVGLDKTSPNYPATVGAKVVGNLVTPTNLAALGVNGIESTNPVSIVKN